jgi:hypothetical protein
MDTNTKFGSAYLEKLVVITGTIFKRNKAITAAKCIFKAMLSNLLTGT